MNEQNLIPLNQRAKNEQREIARKGGLARGAQRLAKKRGRELVQALLAMKELDDKVLTEVANSFGVDREKLTKEIAMQSRQIDKAIRKADTKAYLAVSKAAGYMDEDKGDKETTINITIGNEAAAAGDKWSSKQ